VRAAARTAGNADALVRALFAVAARAPKPLAVELYREAATAARADLGDLAITGDALIRAHRLAPGDGELVAALADLLESEGDYPRLADVYERAALHAAGHDRARWLLALALLCRDKLGDPGRAKAQLEAAHAAAPELPTVWLPLADVRMADDDVAGARDLFERAAASLALDATTRTWAHDRVAALDRTLDRDSGVTSGEIAPATPRTRTAPLGSGGRTVEPVEPGPDTTRRITLRGLAAIRPGDGPASDYERELRLGAELAAGEQLEAAIARYEAAAVVAPTGDLRALTALEQLHDVRGDGEAVSDVIGRQIIATADGKARARLWWRRAQLYRDSLHREADTYRCLKEAHACDPDDLDIAYELRAVAMARGEWALTASLLDREIASAPTARDRGALHLELALVFDEKLLDPDAARRHYEAALAEDPTIPAVPRPLARIYALAGRYRDAATMLEEAARLAPTGEKAALLARAAADAARAGDRQRAVELANAAADAALSVGNHEAAARARAEAARLGAEPTTDAASARDLDEREADLARAIAAGDGAAVETAARGVLAVAPAHGQAFRLLFERAEARNDWTTAAELCAARASAETDPTERASHWFELGRLHAERRADPRAARTAWNRALEAEPSFAPALDALADLAYRERDLANADKLYARLPVATSRLPADVVLMRRAELAEALGDDTRALTLAQGAARVGPSRKDIYATCARLAAKVGDLEAAIRAARAGLELLVPDDVGGLTAARLELAELCRRAGDTIGAVYYHELVVADEPHHARAARGSGRALRRARQLGRRGPRAQGPGRDPRPARSQGRLPVPPRRAGPDPARRSRRRRRRLPARRRSRSHPPADPASAGRGLLARRRRRRPGRRRPRSGRGRGPRRAGHRAADPGADRGRRRAGRGHEPGGQRPARARR
jgi:tetratricopeptide (TPR) repeat protein